VIKDNQEVDQIQETRAEIEKEMTQDRIKAMTEEHQEKEKNYHADNGKPQENVALETNAGTRMIHMEKGTYLMNQEIHKNQANPKGKEKAKAQ